MAEPVSLTEKFRDLFTEDARTAGESACEACPELTGPELFAGTVGDGDGVWDVELVVEGRRLRAACDCHAGAERGEMCAHMWAMVVKAEEFGDLGAARKRSVSGKEIMDLATLDGGEEDEGDAAGVLAAWDEPTRKPNIRELEMAIESLRSAFDSPAAPRDLAPSQRAPGVAIPDVHYLVAPQELPKGRKIEVRLYWAPGGQAPTWDERHAYEAGQPEESPEDREVTRLLIPFQVKRWGQRKLENAVPAQYQLEGGMARTAMRYMGRTGRLHLRTGKKTVVSVCWHDDGGAWAFAPQVMLVGHEYEASAWFHGPEASVELADVTVLGDAFAMGAGHGFEYSVTGATRELRRLFEAGGRLRLSEAEARDWAVRWRMGGACSLEQVADELIPDVRQVPASTQVHVRTARYKYQGREQLHLDLSFVYAGQVVAEKTVGDYVKDGRKGVLLTRDPEVEAAAGETLRLLGCRLNSSSAKEEIGWKLVPRELDSLVWELVERDWLVTAEGKTYRRPLEKSLQVSSGTDWLEVRGGVEFEGEEVPLPKLLAAARRGASAVRLDDGTYGLLPREWLESYTVLTDLGEVVEGVIRFRLAQAAVLDALLGERGAEGMDALATSREALHAFSGTAPADAPPGFEGTLREYQRAGLGWLLALREVGLGGCLADDMGLGKTVQVLALLAGETGERSGPSLVVAPKTLVFNWESEAARFAPGLRVHAHLGSGRARRVEEFAGLDLVLTTYGTLRQDVEFLASVPFHYVILDESQAIKNADTSTAKCARALRADHRLAMTGTPVENRLADLFSQFQFLNPGLFGSDTFLSRISRNAGLAASDAAAIGRALRPLILRRTKAQVVKELPPKTEQTLFCELGEEQRREYDRLRDYYRDQLTSEGGAGQMAVLEALLRLRQVACHAGLVSAVGENVPSAKLDLLLTELETLREEGRKALVFSQFTGLLRRVEAELQTLGTGYCYLDGGTRDRGEVVRQFQEDARMKVFLISLKAGGVGLNLTAADTVFLLDPWWNPAAEAQAIDRTYRIGQDQPVFAYRLIARDTVEEKVLALQTTKRQLAAAVVGSDEGFAASLTVGDLRLLLG